MAKVPRVSKGWLADEKLQKKPNIQKSPTIPKTSTAKKTLKDHKVGTLPKLGTTLVPTTTTEHRQQW